MRHEERKKYIVALERIRNELYKNGVILSKRFDPRRWLRGYLIEKPEINWYDIGRRGGYVTLDFWLRIKPGVQYIKLRYVSIGGKYYLEEYSHPCSDTFSTRTADPLLFCKHLYAAILSVQQTRIDSIDEIMFVPNQHLLKEFQDLEREMKYKPDTKLFILHHMIADKLTPEEKEKLNYLNRALFRVKKV